MFIDPFGGVLRKFWTAYACPRNLVSWMMSSYNELKQLTRRNTLFPVILDSSELKPIPCGSLRCGTQRPPPIPRQSPPGRAVSLHLTAGDLGDEAIPLPYLSP
jgi:hypothetical protein